MNLYEIKSEMQALVDEETGEVLDLEQFLEYRKSYELQITHGDELDVIRRINLRRLSQIKTNEKTEKMEHTSNKTPPKSHIIQGHEKTRRIKLKAQM